MKATIVMAACNAGPLLLETVQSLDECCADGPDYEIIVVNDQSQDDVCDKLPSHVRRFDTPRRLGCSGSRHFGGKFATGDVIIVSDPHCSFSPGAILELTKEALTRGGCDRVVQPLVTMEGHSNRSYSLLEQNDMGLRTRVVRRRPQYPILIGSIYAFNRDIWSYLGGYAPLPGWWDYDEPYLSVMAYRMGLRIETVLSVPKCVHRIYRRTGRLPFSLPPGHRERNAHWFHAVCLSDYYQKWFKSTLNKSMPADTSADFASEEFQAICEHVQRLATHREGWVIRNVVVN